MTWGKALLEWTRTADEALRKLIDLNHRYALDGRDPASYGGILWCLGQFDRPFTPEQSVTGTVRTRNSKEHAKRLDLDRFEKHVTRDPYAPMPRIAIVGAGLGGIMCGRFFRTMALTFSSLTNLVERAVGQQRGGSKNLSNLTMELNTLPAKILARRSSLRVGSTTASSLLG